MTKMRLAPAAMLAALLLVACDDDPNRPDEVLRVTCPSSTVRQGINQPIQLAFNTPVLGATVNASSILVSDATTGVEVPGSVRLEGDSLTAIFTPSGALPYDTLLRVRVQNLRSVRTGTQVEVTTCLVRTELPPITQLFWEDLATAGGARLRGATLLGNDEGYVISEDVTLFERFGGGDFDLTARQPYFTAGFDLDFVDAQRGFASYSEFRTSRGIVTFTQNGAATADTVGVFPSRNPQRIYVRPTVAGATGGNGIWGVVAGGSTFITTFWKYNLPVAPATIGSFTRVFDFAGTVATRTGNVRDVDFAANDTTIGYAVTEGNRTGTSLLVKGALYRTLNGGTTWERVPGINANDSSVTWYGVARRSNGDIFITGGYGFAAKFTPNATGGFTMDSTLVTDQILVPNIPNTDFEQYESLIYTDVQFAPDNDQIGWIVGAQLVGFDLGNPRFQGLIFQTCDGGNTWTRQGVRQAGNYGASFPRINRIEIRSSSQVWLVGDGGVVLTYRPNRPACS